MSTSAVSSRGLFLVFEGLDRSGKSTQSERLANYMKNELDLSVKKICFPNRETSIGSTINSYLQNKSNLSDAAIHLLFSANRWEVSVDIEKWLNEGTHVICDRYAFSGVAYTAAKNAKNMDFNWCKQPDVGLPAPDRVFFLEVDQETAKKRANFGEERYEKAEFQKKVGEQFQKFKDEKFWTVLDASREMDEISKDIKEMIGHDLDSLKSGKKLDIQKLWSRGNNHDVNDSSTLDSVGGNGQGSDK